LTKIETTTWPRMRLRLAHQRQVALVERAHGRHQRHRPPSRAAPAIAALRSGFKVT
jgi:hypothetical protein